MAEVDRAQYIFRVEEMVFVDKFIPGKRMKGGLTNLKLVRPPYVYQQKPFLPLNKTITELW